MLDPEYKIVVLWIMADNSEIYSRNRGGEGGAAYVQTVVLKSWRYLSLHLLVMLVLFDVKRVEVEESEVASFAESPEAVHDR